MDKRDVLILPILGLVEDRAYTLTVTREILPPLDPYWLLGPIQRKKKTVPIKPLDGKPFPIERLFARWAARPERQPAGV